jgi:hypothetical protein
MSLEDNKKAALRAITYWDGKDHFQLMVELSQRLDVNLFDVYLRRMRLKTALKVRNKHTGDEGYISKIEKHYCVGDYSGEWIDGDWYYEITEHDGRRQGVSAKSLWEHWDVME